MAADQGTSEFIIRTEDLRADQALDVFVETERDKQLVAELRSHTPLIIEGSRGTGKSLLLRVCEQRQLEAFQTDRILPVYVTFQKSSLLNTPNATQFLHWMLSRICSGISRAVQRQGLQISLKNTLRVLTGEDHTGSSSTKIEQIAAAYEASYRTPHTAIDDSKIPSIESFRDAIQDLCEELGLARVNILFDEAAHIFRPEQQRQFFTLFRDLRSPYMTCNAAVYPGVTAYGGVFESTHDATIEQLSRDVTNADYLRHMREIVLRQASSELQKDIERNGANFDALAIAVTGNPRLLLKTVAMSGRLNTTAVQTTLREFYREGVWAEHSGLSERYPGHRELIDWGRSLIANSAIPEALRRNSDPARKADQTAIVWFHRDTPAAAKEAIRLLTYTGVLTKIDEGVLGSWSQPGTRYLINLGCLVSGSSEPISAISDLRRGLSIRRFVSYGASHAALLSIAERVGNFVEADVAATLWTALNKPVDDLDLTPYQRSALKSIGIDTVGKALNSKEEEFQAVKWIGPIRSRQMMNVVTSAALEFLSG